MDAFLAAFFALSARHISQNNTVAVAAAVGPREGKEKSRGFGFCRYDVWYMVFVPQVCEKCITVVVFYDTYRLIRPLSVFSVLK